MGFVELFQTQADPVFTFAHAGLLKLQPSSEAFRLWVQFFSNNNPSFPSVTIPDAWMNFFTLLLLQSPTFDWAKGFLQSPAWDYFKFSHTGNSSVFSIPDVCSPFTLPVCSNFELTSSVVIEDLDDNATSQPKEPLVPTTPKRKRITKSKSAPISEADVRRSLRIKKANKGFKTSACKDKNCLGCSAGPPTISPKVIRDLGASFYNIDPKELTDSKLNAKPKKGKAKDSKADKAKKGKKAKPSSSQSSSH